MPPRTPRAPDGAGSDPATPGRRGPTRRVVLLVGGGATAVAAVAAGLGDRWRSRPTATATAPSARVSPTTPTAVTLPPPADAAPPLPGGLEASVPGLSSFRTPTASYYRVDTSLAVPRVDRDGWRLVVDGDVAHPLTLTLDELAALPLLERHVTTVSAAGGVGSGFVGSATWLGVRLTDLLDRAVVGRTADQVLSTAVDGFTISTPLAAVRDGRDALVAIGMNGLPLEPTHGAPARLVVPGLHGHVGATKWLARLTLTTYAAHQASWTRRGWATDAPVRVASRIDTPGPLAVVPAGRTVVAGVAWAPPVGIGLVEVSVDGGAWRRASLGPDGGPDYWRQWSLPWTATAGRHSLTVRATDLHGRRQSVTSATPFPQGPSGLHRVVLAIG